MANDEKPSWVYHTLPKIIRKARLFTERVSDAVVSLETDHAAGARARWRLISTTDADRINARLDRIQVMLTSIQHEMSAINLRFTGTIHPIPSDDGRGGGRFQ